MEGTLILRPVVAIGLALGACGGREPAPARAVPRPRTQLLGCAPATRRPVLEDDGVSFGGLTRAEAFEVRHPGVEGIDAATMTSVIRTQLPAIRDCYARELATNWSSRTGSGLAFTIEADGHVSSVSPGSGGSAALGQCLTRVISLLKFPPPGNGATIRVAYPYTFSPDAAPGVPPRAPVLEPVRDPAAPVGTAPWSPYALEGEPELETDASAIARGAELALRARLDRVELCFPGSAPSGSMRAMLDVDAEGTLLGIRVGGLGDAPSELCVRKALDGLHLVSAPHARMELACDLARGDAERWRLALADYEVITATATQLGHDGLVITPGAAEPDALPGGKTYAVILSPATPGTLLELALTWANDGDGTLIGLATGSGAPVFVGVGRSTDALGDAHDDAGAIDVTLEVDPDRVAACFHGTATSAALSDRAAVHALLAQLAASCRGAHCASTVGLAVDGGASAGALAAVMDEVRRAGFERTLIGGGLGCRVAADP